MSHVVRKQELVNMLKCSSVFTIVWLSNKQCDGSVDPLAAGLSRPSIDAPI